MGVEQEEKGQQTSLEIKDKSLETERKYPIFRANR